MKFSLLPLQGLMVIAAIASTPGTALAETAPQVPTNSPLSQVSNSDSPQTSPISQPITTPTPDNSPATPSRSLDIPSTLSQPRQTPSTNPSLQPLQYQTNAAPAAFYRAPRLTRTSASHRGRQAPSTYEFTVTVPSNAGAALQALKIVQEPNIAQAYFNVDRSRAFTGDQFGAGNEIRLASTGGNRPDANEVTVFFDQPVQPGSTVTVALDVAQNPTFSGVYEFGVTAYPTQAAVGQSSTQSMSPMGSSFSRSSSPDQFSDSSSGTNRYSTDSSSVYGQGQSSATNSSRELFLGFGRINLFGGD